MKSQRHALVVGGVRGLGRATAEAFSRDGWAVDVIDLLAPPADAATSIRWLQANLGDAPGLAAALDTVVASGPLDALVCLQRFRGAGDPWESELRVTLTATRLILDRLAGSFSPGGAGVVLIGSVASRFVAAEQPVGYHVAKAGLAALARHYAVTLGPLNIRVNVLAPAVFTRAENRLDDEQRYAAVAAATPLGAVPRAEELAETILFLAGPAGRFITGQEIIADGGLSLLAQATLLQEPPETGPAAV